MAGLPAVRQELLASYDPQGRRAAPGVDGRADDACNPVAAPPRRSALRLRPTRGPTRRPAR